MNEQTTQQTVTGERSVFEEMGTELRRCFGISDQVAQHFRNARIEVLKGMRQMIDDRIDQINKVQNRGTKIVVE
jgi:hypothetical protein